jgi:predicted amidohydrolase YtcJ
LRNQLRIVCHVISQGHPPRWPARPWKRAVARVALLPLLLAVTFPPEAAVAAAKAELAFRGGPIHTADPERPVVEAVAVADGAIVYAGDAAGLGAHLDRKTRVVDLEGRALVPGFVDGHARLLDVGRVRGQVDLSGAATWDEVTRRLARAARRATPGQWVLGFGWDQESWIDSRPIRLNDLQQATGNRPTVVFHATDDVLIANVPAMAAAGIDGDLPDPPGGRIRRTPGGVRTGELMGEAGRLVTFVLPKLSAAEYAALYVAALDSCAGNGITTVHDVRTPAAALPALRELYRRKETRPPLRMAASILIDPITFAESADIRQDPSDADRGFHLKGLAFDVDGGVNTGGAALTHRYADDSANEGYLRWAPAALALQVATGVEHGLPPMLELHGDRALDVVLDLLDSLRAEGRLGGNAPVALHGLDLLRDDQLLPLRESGAAVTVIPPHLVGGLRWIGNRLGDAPRERPWAFETLRGAGIPVGFGTGAPHPAGTPLLAFYAAVARQDLRGRPTAGWRAEDRLSREAALAALTVEPARALGLEDRTGSIAVGKAADLVVLSRDLMTVPERDIPRIRVDMTVAGGRIVHERAAAD